jgi:hypothetical protein
MNRSCPLRILAAAFLVVSMPVPAQDAGHRIMKHGVVNDDVYLAGSSVAVHARVEGDLVAAGGEVQTTDTVRGDVLMAGGTVHVRGRVEDDVRAVGADVNIDAKINDDLLAAGGNVNVSPGTTVGGRAWLAGGAVDMRGTVGEGLKIAGGRITVGGNIDGDAELMGENIEILPGTVIRGNLTYWGPTEIALDKTVRVGGAVTHVDVDAERPRQPALAGLRFGMFTTLAVAAVVLTLLFPGFTVETARTVLTAPWKSLGLGLAMLMTTPLVMLLLFISLLGIWLGLALLALYFLLLLGGVLTGMLSLAELGLKWRRTPENKRRWRIGAIVVVAALLWLICLIPGVGPVVMFALLVFGLGALTLALWRGYRPGS